MYYTWYYSYNMWHTSCNNWLEDPSIDEVSIDDLKYKLRFIASIEYKDKLKYSREVYTQHENKQTKKQVGGGFRNTTIAPFNPE